MIVRTRCRLSRVWVFDLDNTLHNAVPQIFPHISRAMTCYLQSHLSLDEAAANQLRIHYWRRYGATLLGLIRHHPEIAPRQFLLHTHRTRELAPMLNFASALPTWLRALPGKKVLLSNAPEHYARAVLRKLAVAHLFSDVIAIEGMRFRPKPGAQAFRKVFARHGIAPGRAVMVDDDLLNLRTAKQLGMRTAWVTGASKSPPFVDVRVKSVAGLRRNLNKI